MVKVSRLGELTDNIWVNTVNPDSSGNADKELQAGIVVEILGEYLDQGFWSDGDPYHVESPFPAYIIRYDGIKYDSVHTKMINLID